MFCCNRSTGTSHAALPSYFLRRHGLSTSAVQHAAFKPDWAGESNGEPDVTFYTQSGINPFKPRKRAISKVPNEPFRNVQFTPLGSLDGLPRRCYNVIGLCSSVHAVSYPLDKNGNPVARREIVLQDRTGFVRLILWGNKAEPFNGDEYLSHFVAVTDCKILNYGRTLSTTLSGVVAIDPKIEETRLLDEWYQPTDIILDCGVHSRTVQREERVIYKGL